jgi:plasmid stabilization system protein ParE
MKVLYTATAFAAADDILARIAGDNPVAAAAVGAAIKAAVAQILSFPPSAQRPARPASFSRSFAHTGISFCTGST